MSELRTDSLDRLKELKARAKRAAPVAGLVTLAGLAGSYLHFRYDLPFRLIEKTAQAPPRSLPPAVQRDQSGVLKVYSFFGSTRTEGSGVKVGANLALTAAHVVRGKAGNQAPQCKKLLTQNAYSTAGNTDLVTNVVASPGAQYNRNNPDIASLKVASDPAFDKVPVVPVATHTAKKGDTVYFVNYELDRSSGTDHYPNRSVIPFFSEPDEIMSGMQNFYGTPAEYAGIVVGQQDSMLEVATGLQGYGAIKGREENSYEGASGGLVDDSHGELVGLSVAFSTSPQGARSIDHQDWVHLPVPYSTEVSISFVQPVTQSIVSSYQRHLDENSIC